eukprot:COSAG06_NODE_1929_length_8050_cov_21.547478_2_plen_118_part_00
MKYNAAICPLVWLQEDEVKRGAEGGGGGGSTKKQKQSSVAAAAAAKEEEMAKLPCEELADQLCPDGDEDGEVADENGEVAAVIWAKRSETATWRRVSPRVCLLSKQISIPVGVRHYM